MPEVVIYSSNYCGFCFRAKQLLQSKGVKYKEIVVDGDTQLRTELARKAGARTVPQIWIGDTHVGGCDELYMLERAGSLNELLASE